MKQRSQATIVDIAYIVDSHDVYVTEFYVNNKIT